MRFTVHYIPLSKIKPVPPQGLSKNVKRLQGFLWDCMHVIIVRKNKKDGSYAILSGVEQYEFLRNHTNKKYAPCLIDECRDESKTLTALKFRHFPFRDRRSKEHNQSWIPSRLTPTSLLIIRSFLKKSPEFKQLSRMNQVKVLLLAVRYKKTAVSAMKVMAERLLPPS